MKIAKCETCTHYWGRGKCRAYPEAIPREIIWWNTKHDKIIEGQTGNYIFESKYPEQEKASKEAEEKFRKELFENIEKYKEDFSELILRQFNENNLGMVEWGRIVLHVSQKRGWDTIIEKNEFYVEFESGRIDLEQKYFREWRRLRRRLWIFENIKRNKDFIRMNFVLDRKEGLKVTGLEEFQL